MSEITKDMIAGEYEAHVIPTTYQGKTWWAIQYYKHSAGKVYTTEMKWRTREYAQKVVDNILNSNKNIDII